jgi:hypothetical protein
MGTPSCQNILPYLKPGWVGVEIGVQWGISALAMLQHGCFLYLVDPWVNYEGFGSVSGPKWDAIQEEIYRECRDRLAPYDDGRHFAILRMKSEDAARFIPDNLDFVWVDGNHARDYVKRDLELYWPKIRRGGILCGHDYGGEVKEAVDAFADSIVSFVVPKEGSCWVIFK